MVQGKRPLKHLFHAALALVLATYVLARILELQQSQKYVIARINFNELWEDNSQDTDNACVRTSACTACT